MNLHFNGALASKTHLAPRPPAATSGSAAGVSGGAPNPASPTSNFETMIGTAISQPANVPPAASQPAPAAPLALKSWAQIG